MQIYKLFLILRKTKAFGRLDLFFLGVEGHLSILGDLSHFLGLGYIIIPPEGRKSIVEPKKRQI